MNQTNPPMQPAEPSANVNVRQANRTPLFWRILTWSPVVFVPVLLATLVWAMTIFESVYGPSVQNVVAFGSGLLLALMLIGWFTVVAPLGRTAVIGLWVLLIGGGGAFAASVKSIDFSGDMQLNIRYRWEQSTQQRLADRSASELKPELTQEFANHTHYRGPGREGHIPGPPLKQDWSSLKAAWRVPVGDGYAGVAVAGNLVITLEQRGDEEAIICLNRETGKLIWEHVYPARFFEAMGGLGPRSTPSISGTTVLTQGATGEICCLKLDSGEMVWNRNLLEENNYPNVTWGLSSTPLVVDQTVYVNAGGSEGKGMVALDVSIGSTIWSDLPPFPENPQPGVENRAGYCSPMLAELCGILQLLHFDGEGLRSYDPETGKQFWFSPFRNAAGVSVAQPLCLDQDKVLISESYGVGSALLQLTPPDSEDAPWTIETIWSEPMILRSKFTCPVIVNDYAYGLDEGILSCVDPYTGKRLWRKERFGHGQILVRQNQLLVLSEKGELVLVNPSPEDYDEVTRVKVLSQSSRNWNPPTLFEGDIFVRDEFELACYHLTDG